VATPASTTVTTFVVTTPSSGPCPFHEPCLADSLSVSISNCFLESGTTLQI
jgi:hypothetical protein